MENITSHKIKSEIKSALVIYIISAILARIITILCTPILYLIFFTVRCIIKVVHAIIPESKEEIELEHMEHEEAREQLLAQEEFQRKYSDSFKEWKQTCELPHYMEGESHE